MPSISDFSGLITDIDKGDVPPGGATEMSNVSTTAAGKLVPRKGIQPASFDSTSTLSSSNYNTFSRICFCKTRRGDVIGVNGVDRGFRWDGKTANVEDLGITAPAAAPSIAASNIAEADKGGAITGIANNSGIYRVTSAGHGLGNGDTVRIGNVTATGAMANDLNGQSFTIEGVTTNTYDLSNTSFDGAYTSGGTWSKSGFGTTAGTYVCGYRYIDDTTTAIPSSLSSLTTVTVTENQKLDWSSLSTTTEARAQHKVELYRSAAGVTNVLFRVATLTYSGSMSYTDEVDDATLNASGPDDTLLVLVNPPVNNNLVARRFEPPPNDRPIVVQFQDRYFYGGLVKYNRGTVATNGNTTITGTETDWVSTLVGRYIEIDGEVSPLKITAASATSITTETAASTTASGKSYVIVPEETKRRQVAFSEVDEAESVPDVNVFTVQKVPNDDSEIIALMPFGTSLFLIGKRHKYGFNYSSNPALDGAVRYVEDRGVFNQYAWDTFGNAAYLMDDMGPYVFGGSANDIGQQIKDLWRKDGSGDKIDFAKTDKFFVKCDRSKNRVYFFVSFVGDTESYPTRALVYNITRGTWDLFHYPQQIASAATIEQAGETKVMLGGENEKVYIADKGNTDIVTAEIKGVCTSSSSTTIVDSGASFTSAVVGSSVYIYEGTGKGQRRTITSQTSTQLTVSSWTTTPDTTSKYVVGAIVWNWKSSSFGLAETDQRTPRQVGLKFKPTSNDQRIDIRFYYNNDDNPAENAMSQVLGDAVEIQESNKEDVVVYLEDGRSSLETSSGHERFRFDGMYSGNSHGDHKVSVELRGYSADETQEIQSINVDGVQ